MAETKEGSPPTKNASRGDSWVARHKVALIGGGIAIALVIIFVVLRNRGTGGGNVQGYPTGNTSSLASVNPFLNTSGDLSNLVGPQGPAGPPGPPGKRGPRGKPGGSHHHKKMPKNSGVVPIDHLANAHLK